tara:strand:+ start:98 stop:550 length:453 start_codon:yes stop_codon:yes gene_type:complete
MSDLKRIFRPEYNQYDGIRPINIYAMRLIFLLMAVFLGYDVWGYIIAYQGMWFPTEAMDWSVWAAFSLIAILGIFRTVEMIPVLLVEIAYKLIWLVLVALPLWRDGNLTSTTSDGMFLPFALVVLPMVAVPWGYVFNRYIRGQKVIADNP